MKNVTSEYVLRNAEWYFVGSFKTFDEAVDYAVEHGLSNFFVLATHYISIK